jgi:hypothetical protein
MPERIYKLQPDRTLQLRGFDSFAAAASIHHATPTGFEVSGTFRDPADFAVAVLYDADNFFEHPSIKYLPDFNFSGLTLDFALRYSDAVQPIDSPKYNWIDWATLDVVRPDGTSAKIPLWENATLADPTFPAASATLNVIASDDLKPGDRLTLWHGNLAFDYTVPGARGSSTTYFWQDAKTTPISISVGSRTYSYTVTTPGGETGATIAAGLAAAAAADPQVAFTASDNVLSFAPRVNTGDTVTVIGYNLWLVTASPAAFIAENITRQINAFNWIGANSTHGLIAINSGTAITVTAARYGSVNVNGTSVRWTAGTKFPGLTPGSPIVIAGTAYTIASIESPIQLTLQSPAPTTANATYLAPRGGRDGNMIQLYALANSPSTLSFDKSRIPLTGGTSEVTWNCSLDFMALGIDTIRQCWLTFAPSLANGTAFTPAEWQATFSNWELSGPETVKALQVAGPGSVRIEEDDSACAFTPDWSLESGFYSKYFAKAASAVDESVTITYTCQFTHNLYLGTSLYGTSTAAAGLTPVENGAFYSDRGIAGVRLDHDTETSLDCRVNTGGALVTRRLLRSSVPAGKHTVMIRVKQAGFVYFDFLDIAVLSDVAITWHPAPTFPRHSISTPITHTNFRPRASCGSWTNSDMQAP